MISKPKQFVSLHTHSTFSFTDGYGTAKQYFDRAEKIGMPALAVTDHGNISMHYQWYKEGTARNIKPILGCEMYLTESKDARENKERDYTHVTLLAKNNIGYKNLLKLVTLSWLENFYFKPRITFEELKKHSKGLIVLSGCISGKIPKMIRDNVHHKEIIKELNKWKSAFDDFYIEVSPISFEEGKPIIEGLHKLAEATNTPMVATTDCHFPEPEQSKIQEVLLCIQSNSNWNNPKRWKFDQDDFYLKSREEMEVSFDAIYPKLDFTEALDNTVKIADMVDFTFPKATPMKFPIEDSKKINYFKKLCLEGLRFRGFQNNIEYLDRMNYEMDMIIQKDFVDYFLIVTDLIQWAKKKNILVGPARGSAAGSLVCYLTQITEVDPIPYKLIFERFIDLNRMDLPDIDIDFEDRKRHMIKQYLMDKYGENNVGNIATFSVFKSKSCIADIARVFQLPFDEMDKLKGMIIERSGGDSRASFTLEDTYKSELFTFPSEMLAKYPELHYTIELEGQIRHLSEHASGMIVSNEEVTNFCAYYQKNGEKILSIDYADASAIGLIKFDILGLNTLSSLARMSEIVKKEYKVDIDYYKLPTDDKKTYQGFCDNKLSGIFQFDGQAVNQVCRQIKPKTFEEIGDVNALARPGPLNSGSTTMYIMRKDGKEKIKYPHALMETMTKDTYGIVVYQEQVMRTMRDVGLMSWKDTSDIRKNISRSLGIEKFNTFKSKFEIGAKQNGLTQEEIDTIWDSVCTFGSWAFNKSHSISYALISYWTMYMKMHYPMEFYSVMMSEAKTDDKVRKMIKEARREGLKVLPVDVNRSKRSFSIDKEYAGMRVGFLEVKGIGEKTAIALEENQPYKTFEQFLEKNHMKETRKIPKLLKRVGAFKDMTIKIEVMGKQFEYTLDQSTQENLMKYCPFMVELNILK